MGMLFGEFFWEKSIFLKVCLRQEMKEEREESLRNSQNDPREGWIHSTECVCKVQETQRPRAFKIQVEPLYKI